MEPPANAPPPSAYASTAATTSISATKKRKLPTSSKAGGATDVEVGGEHGPREPKKRPQSCDVCRARKVKCVKQPSAARCNGCASLDQRCVYTHERKKPGPANSYARKSSPPKQLFQDYPVVPSGSIHHRSYSHGATPTASDFLFDHSSMPPPRRSPPIGSHHSLPYNNTHHPHPHRPPDSTAPFIPPVPTSSGTDYRVDASWLPISPISPLHPQPGEIDSTSEDSPAGRWEWLSGMDEILHSDPVTHQPQVALGHTHGGINGGHRSALPQGTGMRSDQWIKDAEIQVDLSPPPEAQTSGSTSILEAPMGGMAEKCMRLEDVAPFSTITRILHAYHAHLYPLMPVMHWPTFSQQLVAREDERSDRWRAFILSLVAYSIIQLPRSALSFIPVRELRRLHQRCHLESRRLQTRRYQGICLLDVATLYCDHIYLGTLGRTHAANVILAEAIWLAQAMNLHDERLSESVDGIERENRRRVFWLLYGSDRTITALTSVPLHIQDCDLCLPLPLAIDDSLLTTAGAFPQPPHSTPVLAGFHFTCRLFRLLGAVLTAHRTILASSLHPSTDPFPVLNLPPLPVPVRPSQHFFDELERVLADLPGPLQLVNPTANGETNPTGTPSTVLSASSQVEGVKDTAFAICRANLLVSQAMVRFAIRQYAKAVGEEEGEDSGREWAERDVLSLLESMSSESLAANGESLRRKVLFVASSLLEKHPSTTEGHNYVSDFLAVYTRISEQQHASLLEDSAVPSREPSPGPAARRGAPGLVGGG